MDLTGLSIEELQEKLASADGYDERAAIRAELRKQKKERGVQSTAIISRKGAPTYNRFGGSSQSSDIPRVRAVTISVSSTTKPKVSRQNQSKAKDDNAVRPVASPQRVPDDDKKITPIVSPEPTTTSDDTPVVSPPPSKSPVTSPEPATEPITTTDDTSVKSPPPTKSPEPVTTTDDTSVKSPPPTKSPPPVRSPPTVKSPDSSASDETDIGIKKTRQPAADKRPSTKQLSSTKSTNEKAEFQGFKLRKTGLSVHDKGRSNKNKATSSSSERVTSSSTTSYSPSKSYSSTRNTTNRTPVSSNRTPVTSDPPKQSGDVTVDQMQQYLVAFVNQALSLDPPLPSAGRPFYSTCSQPDMICSLLNHAVPGTVDMRALSPNQEPDSREANMMLALESARAIGCHIGENSNKLIERGEPQAVRQLVMDIVRAKVVHLPNMEDEPRETFEDPAKLFALLGVTICDSTKERRSDQLSPPPKSTPSPKSTPPPASSRAATDKRSSFDTGLSYEERAALRRAERDERRRQREALA